MLMKSWSMMSSKPSTNGVGAEKSMAAMQTTAKTSSPDDGKMKIVYDNGRNV